MLLATVGDNIFDTLKRNEWSVMFESGCKMFLLNPVYSSLEVHYRKVVPYLVIVGKPNTQYVLAVLIVYYICGT